MANTGFITVVERDVNPNSSTYNTTRVRTYTDYTRCPLDGMVKLRYVLYSSQYGVWRRGTKPCSTGVQGTVTRNDILDLEPEPAWSNYYLTRLETGDCVTAIDAEAARNKTHLQGLLISSTVTSIGNYAFEGCDALRSIIVYATTPPVLGVLVFHNTNNCPIYVPQGRMSAYQAAWGEYASRIREIDPSLPDIDGLTPVP